MENRFLPHLSELAVAASRLRCDSAYLQYTSEHFPAIPPITTKSIQLPNA